MQGMIKVFPPSRVAVISSEQFRLQGNDSDKLLLSFSVQNDGATLKSVKGSYLTIRDQNGKELDFFADAELDRIKDIRITESPLTDNSNYALISSTSIPPRSFYIANQIFFYGCDSGWHSGEKLDSLDCDTQPEIFKFSTGAKYKGRLRIDAFSNKVRDACFNFYLPNTPQKNLFDFSPIFKDEDCS
ncbi:MAG: hypothetical protein AB4050_12730 [Synechococcus sp.]